MRIVTWNLDHGRSQKVTAAQRAILDGLGADIAVLTEVPARWSQPGEGHVVSPPERRTTDGAESWVRIEAPGVAVAVELPFARMAAAATATADDEPILVYGSVLPWRAAWDHAPYLRIDRDETPTELFCRVLADQVTDVRSLRNQYPDHLLVWAGDFNQPLSGPNGGFSATQRDALDRALAELDLVPWNRYLGHAKDRYHAIDLICGPSDRPAIRVERLPPQADGMTLSDHAGYLVDL